MPQKGMHATQRAMSTRSDVRSCQQRQLGFVSIVLFVA